MNIEPGTVEEVLEQAALKQYRHVVIIGCDEDGDVTIHTSEWPEDAQYLVRIGAAILSMLIVPAEELARA